MLTKATFTYLLVTYSPILKMVILLDMLVNGIESTYRKSTVGYSCVSIQQF